MSAFDEMKVLVREVSAPLVRIAVALEQIGKLAKWGWRAEKKRQKEIHAMANWQGARLTDDKTAAKCVYCGTVDHGLRRGNMYFGCMTCVGNFMAEVDAGRGAKAT